MPFPDHIDRVLSAYRVRADTKSALFDLYLSLGDEVLEVFADLADGVTSATMLTPDDTLLIRERLVERYVRRNHPRWAEGKPTASFDERFSMVNVAAAVLVSFGSASA